jgi:hypothetical protein
MMTRLITPPAAAANDAAMPILNPPAHDPIPIPGAFGPRNRQALPAPPASPSPVAPPALHDRAQNERELEGGGDRRYRQPGARPGFIARLFDLLVRSKA